MNLKKYAALLLTLLLLLTGCGQDSRPSSSVPADGDLLVHFIDVGQADCALLECDGEFMLIDGGNVADSDLVVTYLENQGVETLQAVVCSHAHEDHVGGLPAVLAVYPTEHVYAPTRTHSSRCFDDFVYYTDQQGLEIEIPQPGDTFALGDAQVTVLGPVKSYAEPNNTSIVLRVDYGDTSFLFTGDMEAEAETDMMNYWDDPSVFHSNVLKVGHHGSSTSTTYRFLYEIDPEAAVISCGRDNSYGHPHREVMKLLKDAEVPVYRTDEMGTIQAVSDGSTITMTWEKQSAEPTGTEPAETSFIGNKNSKVFHSSTCGNLPKESNQVSFSSYDEAIAAGFKPCRQCLG